MVKLGSVLDAAPEVVDVPGISADGRPAAGVVVDSLGTSTERLAGVVEVPGTFSASGVEPLGF